MGFLGGCFFFLRFFRPDGCDSFPSSSVLASGVELLEDCLWLEPFSVGVSPNAEVDRKRDSGRVKPHIAVCKGGEALL